MPSPQPLSRSRPSPSMCCISSIARGRSRRGPASWSRHRRGGPRKAPDNDPLPPAPRPTHLLTLPTRLCPNPPGSTARNPLTTKMLGSVPQHRMSGRRFRSARKQRSMTGTPRPIGRPDTRRASPKATALRRITPNEERGERHTSRIRGGADPVLRDPHGGRLRAIERACDDGRVRDASQGIPEIRYAGAQRHPVTGGGQLPLRIGRVTAGAPEWVGTLRS